MNFFDKRSGSDSEKKPQLPKHIAIIMDGNGRWAKKRGLPRKVGHSFGARNFRKIAKYCDKIGIKYLTVYAFSTENWKRPKDEVDAIMNLFRDYLKEAISDYQNENIKTRFIGDVSVLDDDLQKLIAEAEEDSSKKTGMTLNIAVNYGGRQEITRAARELCREAAEGRISPDEITEEDISKNMYTAGQPDPDLIIRPSGEQRISNFMLWQAAYSEFYYSNVLWPDFSTEQLKHAINEYNKRGRRFGGI